MSEAPNKICALFFVEMAGQFDGMFVEEKGVDCDNVCDLLPTWNLFVLYFGGWTLQIKVFSSQNKGHLGSR